MPACPSVDKASILARARRCERVRTAVRGGPRDNPQERVTGGSSQGGSDEAYRAESWSSHPLPPSTVRQTRSNTHDTTCIPPSYVSDNPIAHRRPVR